MAIDRIGTFANTQLLLSQMQKSENALDVSNRQVASGKLSNTYAGYGDKTAVMEGARSAAAHADAHYATAQQALTRLDLQDSQLTQLSDLVGNVRQAITNAVANQDATSLMDQLQGYFGQAVEILNSKDANGYLYGGDNNQTAPVTVSTLSQLAALPSAAAAFANGTNKASVRIGDNQTVQVGVLASDVGTQLFSLFQQVAQFDGGVNGPFNSGSASPAQQNFLQSVIPSAANVAAGINSQAGTNGITYNSVKNAMDQLQASATVYKDFVSKIEDVDMAGALTNLNQNQIALQASFQVTSQLNQLSLLNYLQ